LRLILFGLAQQRLATLGEAARIIKSLLENYGENDRLHTTLGRNSRPQLWPARSAD
jgi:hypothetical protein